MTFYGKTKQGSQVVFDGKTSSDVIMTVQDKNLRTLVNESIEVDQARDLHQALGFAISDAERKVT